MVSISKVPLYKPHLAAGIDKHVLHLPFHSLFNENGRNVLHKLLGHQVNTCHLFFVLKPEAVGVVKIEMIMPHVFGQFIMAVLRTDVGKARAIVEIDLTYGRNYHSARESTLYCLRTIVSKTVGSIDDTEPSVPRQSPCLCPNRQKDEENSNESLQTSQFLHISSDMVSL